MLVVEHDSFFPAPSHAETWPPSWLTQEYSQRDSGKLSAAESIAIPTRPSCTLMLAQTRLQTYESWMHLLQHCGTSILVRGYRNCLVGHTGRSGIRRDHQPTDRMEHSPPTTVAAQLT